VANWLSGFVTKTLTVPSTVPSVDGGVVAFSVVLLTNVTLVALLGPKATVAPERKWVPVMVITVPPLVEENAGAIFVIVGAGY